MKIEQIQISRISANTNQPRKYFDKDKIAELALSIKEYGVLQPIIVKTTGDDFEIIAGERRFRASIEAGLDTIPAIISQTDRYTNNRIAIIENIQRENLSAIEEAIAYTTLINDYGLTQIEVSEAMGKRPSTISNKLRLLKLNPQVQEKIKSGELTERHGRILLKLNDDEQVKMTQRIISEGLTVSKVEKYVLKKTNYVPKNKTKRIIASKDFKLAINTVKQAVDLIGKTGLKTSYDEEVDGEELVITIKISKE